MSQFQKIVNKGSHFHKHGKHRSVLMEIRRLQKKPKRKQEWFRSIREAMEAAAKR